MAKEKPLPTRAERFMATRVAASRKAEAEYEAGLDPRQLDPPVRVGDPGPSFSPASPFGSSERIQSTYQK